MAGEELEASELMIVAAADDEKLCLLWVRQFYYPLWPGHVLVSWCSCKWWPFHPSERWLIPLTSCPEETTGSEVASDGHAWILWPPIYSWSRHVWCIHLVTSEAEATQNRWARDGTCWGLPSGQSLQGLETVVRNCEILTEKQSLIWISLWTKLWTKKRLFWHLL